MKIALGSDHAGVAARLRIAQALRKLGAECLDLGCEADQPVDYPDKAAEVAHLVAGGRCGFGILICGTGIGMSIAANKIRGIRAAVCHNDYTTEMARKHNHANILCLGARVLAIDDMERLVGIWLSTQPEGGRHDRRVEKIHQIEQLDPLKP
ncbi:MAG TPA: ribose 5-phosphate isomerase B [Planctomycetota bacterium]|nr:ribose 5-phosphate isomerase B [Planctomycetota bacterium]